MNKALLIVGVFFLLVVAAAIAEAYFKAKKRRPLSKAQPRKTATPKLGQDATTTSILQDMLEDRQHQKTVQTKKDTPK